MRMTLTRLRGIVANISYKDLEFFVFMKGDSKFFQIKAKVWDEDVKGYKMHSGRKWYISSHMTDSEVVQTVFLAIKTWEEHEIRETFTYKGERIFGPHFDVESLKEIAENKHLDVREAV